MSRRLDDWIESYLQYTDNSEPPDSYKEWIAVSVIAAALERKCYLPWGPLTFYPNMYVVLVGPSGKCRKGTAMGIGASFLRKLGVKTASEAITREALIRELNQASGQSVDVGSGILEMHASLTIYSQELTVFLGYDNKQLISDLTDWYDCRDRWTYRTKNMGSDEIIGVWVNLIGATTPELVQSALPRDAIGGGLASRIIFIYEENKGKTVPFPFLSREDVELREALEADLEQINMMSGPFRYTEEFLDVYGDWYLEQEEHPPFQQDNNFAGYVQRRPNHVLKLCVILSASSRDDKIITPDIFYRAVGLLSKAERRMPRVFTGYGSARDADVMSRIMTHISQKKEVDKKELLAAHYADLEHGVKSLDAILQVLSEMGFCSIEYRGNKTIVIFNPDGLAGQPFNN